jgi:HAD superfamily hydrolase (TIGR01450 family)
MKPVRPKSMPCTACDGKPMLDAETILRRYEAVRSRLPGIRMAGKSTEIATLLDITDQIDAFVFDAFGVLNLGERPIDGADRRLQDLRARNCAIRVLTNAASADRAGAMAKFERLGLGLADDEIVTSREATLQELPDGLLGVIAADSDALVDIARPVARLGDDSARYHSVDAFLFLSTAAWTEARQDILMASMARHPRPVFVANADIAAPREHGFTVEPGHFGHLIEEAFPGHVRFFGKPFPEVFTLVAQTLPGVPKDRIAMCGDTLHTDIIGAAAFGWRAVLVTGDGLMAGLDSTAYCDQVGIHANWRLRRI